MITFSYYAKNSKKDHKTSLKYFHDGVEFGFLFPFLYGVCAN
jgi:hypothetical protein